jgi:O-acetylserine/cysteine efflux transporter
MSLRDFLLLCVICLAWGVNLPMTRLVVTDVPPLFYAFMRFFVIAVVLIPFLKPIPKEMGKVFAIAMCIGGGNFALLFLGLQASPASAAAITGQLGLPFTTILSLLFLGEKVRWRRGLGIALAFVGVIVIAYDPSKIGLSVGLLYIVGAAFIGSVGGVMMKQMPPIPALNLQAWVGALSVPPLLVATALLEPNPLPGIDTLGWGPFVFAVAFSALVVSVFGHGAYYNLLKKYDITLLAPLTLMTPVWAVVIGIVFLGEAAAPKLLIGGAITLAGVAMIAVRPNAKVAPEAIAPSSRSA